MPHRCRKIEHAPAVAELGPLGGKAIAAVVGFLLGVGLAFLREVLDRRIRTEEQVQQILDLPVLGSIPDIDSKVFKSSAKAAKREAAKQYGYVK